MDLFSSLLSGVSLALLAAGISFFIIVRALVDLANQMAGLRTRLHQVSNRLKTQLADIPPARENIKEMQEEIAPIKNQLQEFQSYYSVLMDIERENAKAEQEEKAAGEIQMRSKKSH